MAVIGIDPGINGAIAYYDKRNGIMVIEDMPAYYMNVGKKVRKRIDAVKLVSVLDLFRMFGADLLVMEAVGGRPNQSAAGGFVFGYTVGLVYMAAIMLRIPIDTVPSQTWKRIMKLPGKTVGDNKDIIKRADDLLPAYRDMWRGPKGGLQVDRAEAALIAKFGEDHVLKSEHRSVAPDPEGRLLDTGA